MGERWFRQEYLCNFEDGVSGVFARELVESAITCDVKSPRIPYEQLAADKRRLTRINQEV